MWGPIDEEWSISACPSGSAALHEDGIQAQSSFAPTVRHEDPGAVHDFAPGPRSATR